MQIIPTNLATLVSNGKIFEAIEAVKNSLNTSERYIGWYCDVVRRNIGTSPSPSDAVLENWMRFICVFSEKIPNHHEEDPVELSDMVLKRMLPALRPDNAFKLLFAFFKQHVHKATAHQLISLSKRSVVEPVFITLVNELEKNAVIFSSATYFTLQMIKNKYINATNSEDDILKLIYNVDIDILIQLRNYFLEVYDLALFTQIQAMIDKHPPHYSAVLSDRLNNKKNLLFNSSSQLISHLNQLMKQIIQACGHISTDETSVAGFILAAIRQDKVDDYIFLPTLLFVDSLNNLKNETSEFVRYLKCIADMPPPVHERFVIASPHWLSGEIKVDTTGEVHIFICDPIRANDNDFIQTLPLMNQIFINKAITLYFASTVRQSATEGCSVFALDDVRHFYTIDRYAANGRTLFEQLDARCQKKQKLDTNTTVSFCKLPAPLLRTTQSVSLFESISDEMTLITNKKGETVEASIKKTFPTYAYVLSGKLTGRNQRLELKREKMFERVDMFILNHLLQDNSEQGYEKLKAMAGEHSLSAFLNRVSLNQDQTSDVKPIFR